MVRAAWLNCWTSLCRSDDQYFFFLYRRNAETDWRSWPPRYFKSLLMNSRPLPDLWQLLLFLQNAVLESLFWRSAEKERRGEEKKEAARHKLNPRGSEVFYPNPHKSLQYVENVTTGKILLCFIWKSHNRNIAFLHVFRTKKALSLCVDMPKK